MDNIEIVRIPALTDNYIWLARSRDSGQVAVIDPAVAEPVLEKAAELGWRIDQIWNTHWHSDHTGGNAGIKAATGARIYGPAAEAQRIATLDEAVGEGRSIAFGATQAIVHEVPGHTAGHIMFHLPEDEVAFVGDTLFAMGCGRLFEGTAEQMFANMQLFRTLDPATRIYCAHEYTEANGRYALIAEPHNAAIAARMTQVAAARARGEATVPTTIALELATNPFLRASSAQELAARRLAKDAFKG